jgi:hypothetical protein
MKDIMMNGKEQQRAMILTAAVEGRSTAREASFLSTRQAHQFRRRSAAVQVLADLNAGGLSTKL